VSSEPGQVQIDQVASGKRALRKLFSEDQKRFIGDHGPVGFSWDELSVLGPVGVRKWELEPNGFPREITVEEWTLPDDSDLIEPSTKIEPAKAVKLGAAFRDYVVDRALDPNGDHQTKTRTALRLFTGAG
jgi:hypothetical protein